MTIEDILKLAESERELLKEKFLKQYKMRHNILQLYKHSMPEEVQFKYG